MGLPRHRGGPAWNVEHMRMELGRWEPARVEEVAARGFPGRGGSLGPPERAWLRAAIGRRDPGHPWLDRL